MYIAGQEICKEIIRGDGILVGSYTEAISGVVYPTDFTLSGTTENSQATNYSNSVRYHCF